MSNLIPRKNKKEIKKEYLMRLLSVALIFIALLLSLSIILTVPSYFASINKASVVEERLSFLRKYVEENKNVELPIIVQETKEKMAVLATKKGVSVFNIINTITKNEGENVKLNTFSYRILEDGEYQAFISGVSSDRDSLINFRKRLEQTKEFFDVNLPISDLAESRDIDFSINIKIKSVKEN